MRASRSAAGVGEGWGSDVNSMGTPIIVSAAKGKDIGTLSPKTAQRAASTTVRPQRVRSASGGRLARTKARMRLRKTNTPNEKGVSTPVGGNALSWSAAVSAAHEALFGIEVTEYASRGNLPTSLLNHETSDHLLSR